MYREHEDQHDQQVHDPRRRMRGGFGPRGEHFAGWGFGPGRGRGGGRARRGDVRAAILALLAERPMHGYEMIQELEQRTGGLWRPSPGSVYPALQLLEESGLTAGNDENGKRLFTLTDEGRAELERGGNTTPWDDVTRGVDPGHRRFREAIGQVVVAAGQVGSAGSEEQKTQALEVLAETRRKLYAILAAE
jgi:DNA-binding PadR family transcriptional regulator